MPLGSSIWHLTLQGEGTQRGPDDRWMVNSVAAAERPSTMVTEKQSLGLLAGGSWIRCAGGEKGVCPEPKPDAAAACAGGSGASRRDQGRQFFQLFQDIWL